MNLLTIKDISQLNRMATTFTNPTHIIFDSSFNQQLKPGDIPQSATHVVFGSAFNKILSRGVIPLSVTHLVFDECFNQPLKPGDIPNSVTYLAFGCLFNQPLEPESIPSSVTHLKLGNNFNQLLGSDNIPPSITHLILGRKFNQPLKSSFLPSIKFIKISSTIKNQIDIPRHVKIESTIHNYEYMVRRGFLHITIYVNSSDVTNYFPTKCLKHNDNIYDICTKKGPFESVTRVILVLRTRQLKSAAKC